jgi:hypothetical protein
LARGGSEHKDEVRARFIIIRQETYDRLRKLWEFGMDFNDVITTLIKEHYNKKNVK